jgi:hypothetical protein
VPGGWSPDGTLLFAAVGVANQRLDIGVLTVGDPGSWKLLLQDAADERNPMLSPDGRWLAYASRVSGDYEVYVQRFPDGGGRQQVSVDGGHTPFWSADGRALSYGRVLAGAGAPSAVARVTIEAAGAMGAPLAFGSPVDLFSFTGYFSQIGGQRWFDMSLRGERFLMIKNSEAESGPPILIVVQQWGEELKRLAPTD